MLFVRRFKEEEEMDYHDHIQVEAKSTLDRYGWTQLDNVVLMSPKLHNHSKMLYLHLKNFFFKVSRAYEFGVYKTFYISREELGRLMQMSASSIDGYMKPLKDAGLIEIKSQGIGKPNVYLLNIVTDEIVDWLEPDIKKWKDSKNGLPHMVNDQEQPTKTGSPNMANDHIVEGTPQNTAKDPAESCHQIKNNNLNKDNNNMQSLPSNMSKKKSLFDLPSKPSTIDPMKVLDALKGKSKLTRKIQFIESGELGLDELNVLDLCFYYATKHKEIVGYEVPYQKEQYMQQFVDMYNLTLAEAYTLIPKFLETFRAVCEQEKRKKSEWNLKIGFLIWENDIAARIMDKVKPKVNEKYLEKTPEEKTPENSYEVVDEVF
jgi:hypothetical protein